MRTALFACAFALALLPATSRAEEVSVKLHPLEEWGTVVAASGASGILAGGILFAMGLDRRLAPGEKADEIFIAIPIMAGGAAALCFGTILAFWGKAKRNEEEAAQKASATIVPTLGGAAAVVRF